MLKYLYNNNENLIWIVFDAENSYFMLPFLHMSL